jgi:DNA mismatch repair protein MutS
MTTPMMQQHQEAKARHPGMMLLFRSGDFYELFFEDAEIISRVLGLTLTKRGDAPMAGFPHQKLEDYLRQLLRAGHRVAVCDQVEEASQAKGRLIRREVTRVVTPGTLTEDDLLDPKSPNHLVAITSLGGAARNPVGIAWVDLSAGKFHAADFPRERLADQLGRLAPSECLVGEMAANAESAPLLARLREVMPSLTVSPRPDWTFDPASARAALYAHFHVSTMAGFGFDDDQPCLSAAGALLLYLQETLKSSLAHLRRLRPYAENRFLFLDDVTRRSLELTRTLRDNNRDGSLLSVIDRTVTSMGARLLQEWLLSPLRERAPVEARLSAVAELVESHTLRQELRAGLAETFDLQRLTSRVSTARATPRDLVAIGRTLALLPRIKAKLAARQSALLAELDQRIELYPDLRAELDRALLDDPPQTAKEGDVIKRGYDKELDHWHEIASGGRDWISRYQAEEILRTGIASLKVRYNQVFGYFIEVTNAHAAKIPPNYTRRGTLKNSERYVTPELKQYEEEVLGAQEKIYTREYELFVALRERVAEQTGRLLTTAEALAQLDALAGLAELAAERGYSRPVLTEQPLLEIRDGRHAVLDQTLPPGTFVPNDTAMGADHGALLLITGPNMGGKSVYIRQVAIMTLLAQMGSFVPAKSARIGLVDRIFTRVGASDELSRSQSTFMVEMTEAANILNNATAQSLVILDEIGRGTSTYDGVSLAWGITEYLHDTLKCRTLFATHYHELAELAERLPNLRNYNVLVHEADDGIVFLHKMAPGSADQSYGIHVAQRAGVPEPVLARARQVLAELEAHHLEAPERPGEHLRKPKVVQASLFAGTDDPVIDELRRFDPTGKSAEEIVAQIQRWQRDLDPQKKN